MGKQRGRSNSSFDKLIGRLESCDLKKLKFVDNVVAHLQSKYSRDYARVKVQPFTKQVERALEIHRRRSTDLFYAAGEFDDSASNSSAAAVTPSPARKRLKRFEEEREHSLQRREADYLRKKRRDQEVSSSSEEEDGGVSSSDDVIFESKVDPEFDLMKDMLRTNYENNAENLNSKDGAEVEEEERNVEVEVCDKEKKVGLVENVIKKGMKSKNDGSKAKEEVKGGDGGREKSGPRFKDIGGIKGVLDELMMEIIFPLCHPQLPRWLGVMPMSGILLHGPPGCGKTKLAHAIANETGVPFYKISATEVVSGVSGASEENIRDLFEKAYRTAPSIIFIDEIDSIASKRENLQREMERRIVTQLMTCMDESNQIKGSADVETNSGTSEQQHGHVLVIGATNRPDAIDPAIRRPGRFDREINLGVPDENARFEIMSVLTQSLRLEGTFDLEKIAKSTPGFVGADLVALVNRAGNIAMKRIAQIRKSELLGELKDEGNSEQWLRRPWMPEEMESLSITMADFEEAATIVQPSTRREGFSTIPNVKWEDVGGLDLLRKEFDRYIISRIKHPKDYEEFGVDLETGFLLYGPPGCGKTLIAKAVANEAGANFIHIKGPELLNKYVGESELAVRTLFARARTCAPCILFFDEVDAITKERGAEGAWVGERLFTQLLIELDGAEKRQGVYVIGATNRPEVMDPAVKRPGRFGKLLYVPLPGPDERGSILRAIARKKPIDEAVDLMAIGRMEACENMSGADLAAVLNEAAMAALEEKQMLGPVSVDEQTASIKQTHFELALQKVSPSVQISKKAPRKLIKALEQQPERMGTLELTDSSSGPLDGYTF